MADHPATSSGLPAWAGDVKHVRQSVSTSSLSGPCCSCGRSCGGSPSSTAVGGLRGQSARTRQTYSAALLLPLPLRLPAFLPVVDFRATKPNEVWVSPTLTSASTLAMAAETRAARTRCESTLATLSALASRVCELADRSLTRPSDSSSDGDAARRERLLDLAYTVSGRHRGALTPR